MVWTEQQVDPVPRSRGGVPVAKHTLRVVRPCLSLEAHHEGLLNPCNKLSVEELATEAFSKGELAYCATPRPRTSEQRPLSFS